MNLNILKQFQIQPKEFMFTKMVNRENADKLDFLFEMEKLINQELKIENYSNKIKELIFVFILHNNSCLPTNDYISLIRRTKTIEIGLCLNYSTFITAENNKTSELMIYKYLNTIPTLFEKRKDFDHKKFYQDNVKLFEI